MSAAIPKRVLRARLLLGEQARGDQLNMLRR